MKRKVSIEEITSLIDKEDIADESEKRKYVNCFALDGFECNGSCGGCKYLSSNKEDWINKITCLLISNNFRKAMKKIQNLVCFVVDGHCEECIFFKPYNHSKCIINMFLSNDNDIKAFEATIKHIMEGVGNDRLTQ